MPTGRTSHADGGAPLVPCWGDPSGLQGLRALVEKSWRQRLNQENGEARRAYLRAREQLGLGRVSVVPAEAAFFAVPLEAQTVVIDCVLLGGSLARVQGKREKFHAALAWAESETERLDLDESFFLHQERGVRAHIAGDYETALTHFLAARGQAEPGWQEAVSLTNALIEMELLGVKADRALKMLNDVIANLSGKDRMPGVERQLRLFNARHWFQQGKPGEAVRLGLRGGSKLSQLLVADVDQVFYLALWIKSLPFTTENEGLSAAEAETLLAPGNAVFQKDYRSRTLRHVLHPDDLDGSVSYDVVDRIYCWTWRWLVEPERYPAYELLKVLTALKPFRSDLTLTFDDREMLHNALLWLGLFAHEPLEKMKVKLARFTGGGERQAPLYTLERLIAERAYALRDGDHDAARALAVKIEMHPLHTSGEVLLAQAAGLAGNARRAGPLATLATATQALAREAETAGARLIVNVARSSIENRDKGELNISTPLVRAITLLREKSVVSADEFLARAFGIGNYNPVVHERKIFNLLARAKTALGDSVGLRVKSGFVVAAGDWSHVRFLGLGVHGRQLAESAAWLALLHGRDEEGRLMEVGAPALSQSGRALERQGASREAKGGPGLDFSPEAWLSRGEVERLSGRPRSTVNRVLAQAVRDGLVKKCGAARATTYCVLDPRALASRLGC